MKKEIENLTHLKGREQISQVFGVSRKTLKKWREEGAPILMLGRKYQANYSDLWDWLKQTGMDECAIAAQEKETKR